jgi:tRNA-specific 2-thiouridylase
MSTKGKVLVAMSGGIDSSVAALLLHEQGYEVIGITMKTWDYAGSGSSKKETGCCNLDSINDARFLAVRLGFPHYILDIRSEFGGHIIDNFVNEYLSGRTPNPCVLCNTHIKWDALLKRADQLGCQYIATGHYARIRHENGRYVISRGLDKTKDQSYVLWGLKQEDLARTLFPLADLDKPRVREIARQAGFDDLASKGESYDICFIPDNDYRSFLKKRVDGLEERVAGGHFVDKEGHVLGVHKGYPFYTIGQRKGLEIALGEPMFVTDINPVNNTVVLGRKEDLEEKEMWVKDFNLIKFARIPDDRAFVTRIRYKDQGAPARIRHDGDRLKVLFETKVYAIAPGQSAVIYDGDDLVGGGIIERKS